MRKDLMFNEHVAAYDSWFEKHPYVFETEVAAIKKVLPEGDNLMSLEVGSGTGRFAKSLGIKHGLDPSANMCFAAEAQGIDTYIGFAEDLPYQSLQFDFVLMTSCISYFEDIQKAFKEAFRVLKPGGILIVGFIEKNSRIGQYYKTAKADSIFYKQARFYTAREVEQELANAGFSNLQFSQTLFGDLENMKSVEHSIPGYDKGSYILIRASKN
ncbi:MAG: class I SAM-dependent methyltransferase [Chitinophagaceae bacterium]